MIQFFCQTYFRGLLAKGRGTRNMGFPAMARPPCRIAPAPSRPLLAPASPVASAGHQRSPENRPRVACPYRAISTDCFVLQLVARHLQHTVLQDSFPCNECL